jgi:alginate O-acetyltransferase complex protein AlgI
MVFSSIAFLYVFLPLALAGHLFLPRRLRNVWLLVCSLVFYTWGEGRMVAVLMVSIGFNYIAARCLGALSRQPRARQFLLMAAVALNLLPLLFFKYTAFILTIVAPFLSHADSSETGLTIPLPLGISFFTFQAISYLIDVARGDVIAEASLITYGAYKSMYPQLIAGPIVRYRDISDDLKIAHASTSMMAEGVERFIIGLAKKLLIADIVAIPADRAFALAPDLLTSQMAWAGLICYALQIYFDFSAYSDMAIGIGRILGFRIPENFNLPYSARSVRDFWRRWHISLSTWFRDYLYIPLGGNRLGSLRTALNLVTVFLLCGLWHGANWTFVIWGCTHGLFMGIEHFSPARNVNRFLGTLYALTVVVLAWVLFRSTSLAQAGHFYLALIGHGAVYDGRAWSETMGRDTVAAIALGSILSLGGWPWLTKLIVFPGSKLQSFYPWLRLLRIWAFIFLCTLCLLGNAYSPFIYFRF